MDHATTPGTDATDELRTIRHEMDVLGALRFNGIWPRMAEMAYDRLGIRELELLAA